ncbi:Hint domain-containing protein [Thalassococcus sp. CAU 1522]|uniref:Hint domain-containing protein n=1 Tax=Thalassococcus arenae TaxID=2851652 RepID=A0ABS6N7W1_9RHOB|nr:Hint domain-containing protein [Thalassococcus arenae]MBV2359762.1 Hint domain-containing protein [Thalassococcus arenae]
MRKYEAAALLPDLTISFQNHVAPAIPLFEEATSAFARGTLIQTVRGPVAIEDLLPGDYIETAGGSEPVMWIGSTVFVPGDCGEASILTHLTRITPDTFGLGRPGTDLLVGPAARMVQRREKLRELIGQDAVLAPVADFADGDRLLRVQPHGGVQLFHLMLKRHTILQVGGIEMESYHPGHSAGQTMSAATRALFLSMFPNLEGLEDFGQLAMTRTTRAALESLHA